MTAAPETSGLSAVKLALLANELRAQLGDADPLAAEPIAILGIGCRLPGGVRTPGALWEILHHGVDAITEVPADRWDIDEFYDPDPARAGHMSTRWGGFVDGIDQFDAAYFGISPREAAHMDPQQRMVLEVAVEALERAGQTTERLAGSLTGVFVAASTHDYGDREHAGAMDIDAYSMSGNAQCIIPNRLSFTLDLRGPSVAIDTACSSSLVAVHAACQSLRTRDCDLALAGGVNALLSPQVTIALSKWGLMAPDGRCKTFDARADGFVRSEGCGMLVLKRLAVAIADGDPVLAVIRGSAVNQDGRSTTMSAPNGRAQQDVIRRALRVAQVRPEQISCVEAHGTGTALGDPIEVEALAEVLGAPAPGVPPVALTAVKTNIGHLEAAAGVAGVIKLVLCLQHGEIPAPVHFANLNPHISIDGTRLFIPTERHAWPAGAGRRIAGVSSFGFGGTNAHVVLEEAPVIPVGTTPDGLPLLVLSAHTPAALAERAATLADQLERDCGAAPLASVLATAALRRTHHDERLAVVGSTADDLVDRLRTAAAGERRPGIAAGRREAGGRRRIAFVCSGQGNQWSGMARSLLAFSPVFRDALHECDVLVRQVVSWSVLDELARPDADSRLARTEFAQPVIFSIQVALAALWRSWGVVPDAVVGHSMGEVAAAHLAGALSLADAVRVIVARGASMRDSFGTGAMASVERPLAAVETAIAPFGDRLSVAAVNAPDVTVISGDAIAITDAVARLRADGIAVRTLDVTYPFHSAQMVPCAGALEEELAWLTPSGPSLRCVSTVTGRAIEGPTFDAAYWARNVAEPVRFADAVVALAGTGCDTFVELGPHPVLGGAIARTLADADADAPAVVSSLRRGRDDVEAIAASLGELHCAGVAVDWTAVWPGRRLVAALPTYPWQHRRHWAETWQPAGGAATVSATSRPPAGAHPLVGSRLRSPAIDGFVCEATITSDAPSFIGQHRIGTVALMPATGFLEAAAAAFEATMGQPAVAVTDVELITALVVADGVPVTMQVHVQGDATAASFVVSSSTDGEGWTVHARGRVQAALAPPVAVDVDAVRARCHRAVDGDELYADFLGRGIDFGPSFRGVARVWVGDGEAIARIEAPADMLASVATYRFHPALLDAAIHPLATLLDDDGAAFLPVAFDRLELHAPAPDVLWSHVRRRGGDLGGALTVDVAVVDGAGQPVATVEGLRAVRTRTEALARSAVPSGERAPAADDLLFDLAWRPAPAPAEAAPPGPWLIVADTGGIGDEVAERLRARGAACVLVPATDDVTAASVRDFVVAHAVQEVVYLRAIDTAPLAPGTDVVAGQRHGLGGALAVAQGLAEAPARLWFVTRGAQGVDAPVSAPEQATLTGLGATVRAERPELRCISVDIDPDRGANAAASVLTALAAGGADELVAVRGGDRFVARLVRHTIAPVLDGPTRLASSSYGVLDGLHLAPAVRRAPGPGEVEVEVVVTGLNFRDVLAALDLYPQRSTVFGDECAGVVIAVGPGVERPRVGERVVALAPGAFASHVTTLADLTFPLPAEIDLEAAATIPIPFLTAQYALVQLGHLRAGERVLIHAGAGGVGMAAIQLSQRIGAEVYATAGSPEKRAVLEALGVQHVFDSRSLDFADGVLAATGGRGVDVVLNSLAGEFIGRSVEVLAPAGRFLEIGRRDVWTAEHMAAERPDVDYHVVFLGDLSSGQPAAIQAMFAELMPRVAAGDLQPLPRVVYEADRVADAFRFMAQARHVGKIVVRQQPPAVSPEGTYLVTGGTGGVGLVVARHLVDRGAGSVALVGRTAPDDRAARAIDAMRESGADVRFHPADVGRCDELADVLAIVDREQGRVRGIVHAAGVTDDAVIGRHTWGHVERVLGPKLAGAWHLHELTLGRDLDLFVVMSAASPVFGAPAQANYVAANAFLDAFASWRRGAGRAATSIGWGVWDRVGMTARLGDVDRARLSRRGVGVLSPAEGAAAFDAAWRSGAAHVLALKLDPAAIEDRAVLGEVRTETPAPPDAGLLQHWAEVVPGMRRTAIAQFVDDQARKVLGLAAGAVIPPRQPFGELGLDSLMAVELRNVIGVALGGAQPATLLFDHPTSESLVDFLVAAVDARSGPPRAEGPTAPDRLDDVALAALADVEMLSQVSEFEAEAILLAELSTMDHDA